MAMMERQLLERIDRMSHLPDEILCHILSFVPTKLAASTSVISSRWTNLWTFLPVLDFECHSSPSYSFMNTVNKVLHDRSSLKLEKLRLVVNDFHWRIMLDVNRCVSTAINRNVVDLNVQVFDPTDDRCEGYGGFMLRILPCDSIQILKICGQFGLRMPSSGCFGNLRKFDVQLNDPDEELLAELFCSLPKLEELSVVGIFSDSMEKNLNICINIVSPTLKRLTLCISPEKFENFDFKILIDAPIVEYISLEDDYLASYLVKNQPFVREVIIDVGEDYQNGAYSADEDRFGRVVDLLEGLSCAKSLSILDGTTLAFYEAEVDVIPKLPCLTKLILDDVYLYGLVLLPLFLESAPNLEVLVLKILHDVASDVAEGFMSWDWIELNILPECLSHLEEFEIFGAENVGGVTFLMDMVDYFMTNGKVLKKLRVDSHIFIEDGVRQ